MNKKKLKITIMLLSLLQMGSIFMAPIMGELIKHFPQYSVSTCQLLMTFPNFMVVFSSIATGKLEPYITKKHFMIFACLCIIVGSLGLFTFHTQLYIMYVFSGLLGIGVGVILSLSATIVSIYFEGEEQAQVYGYQNSITSIGGVMMNLLGGVLVGVCWYLGFLTPLIIIPALLMCFVGIPNEKGVKVKAGQKERMPGIIWLYCILIFIFLVVFNMFPTNMALFIEENKLGGSSLSGVATAVLLIGGAIGGIFFNKLNQLFGEKVLSVGFFNLGLGLLIVSFSTNIPLMLVGTAIGGCSISLMMSRLSMDIAKNTKPTMTPIAMGFMIAFNNCGGFISPKIFSILKGTVANRYLIVGVSAMVFAGLLFIVLKKGNQND